LSVDAFHEKVTASHTRPLTRGLPGTLGAWVSPPAIRHFWLPCPLHVHIAIAEPLAVLPAVTSRQSPDCTPVMLPSVLSRHFWLAPPVQR
jgi:hypothetical protein